METRSDEATWSVSAEVSMRQITGEGEMGNKGTPDPHTVSL